MFSSIILSCDWDVLRLAIACKCFGGLTNQQLAMARKFNGGGLKPVHTVAEKCDCRRCLAVFCDSVERALQVY